MLGIDFVLSLFWTLVLALLISWVVDRVRKKRNNWPPGPPCIPGIGNFVQIMRADHVKPYAAFHKLSKTYGDVMSLQLGLLDSVVLSGYETVRTAMHSEAFLGRYSPEWFNKRTFSKKIGILFGDIPVWKETRRFTVKNLRDYGFGKKLTMESIILEEITDFIDRLKGKTDKNEPVPISGSFDAPVVNSVFAMLCGFRFDHSDPELKELLRLLHGYFASIKQGGDVIAAYPFLARVMPNYYLQQRVHKAMHTFFRKIITDTRDRGSYRTNPENFIDVFVKKIDEIGDSDPNKETFNDESLISLMYDFFMAGAETTSTSIEFLILHLILNPHIQEKLVKEIVQTVGEERWPTYEDRIKMPYTEAVILENLRIATVLPLGPRETVEDTVIGSYKIPKGTFVGVNYYSVHMDEEYWGDPHNFRPERFLDSNGQICNTERLMPFSLGKRNCIGETLAKMNLFLFTVRLFQKFHIQTDPNSGKPSTEPRVGITMQPQPFSAVFKPR